MAPGLGDSKACTYSCNVSTVLQDKDGVIVVTVCRQRLLICAWASVPAGPPRTLPAAPVPGAPRHVCHSIILSGLPGSHYFAAAIIYSLAEPPACGRALTLTSLTAGQEPHSGCINHQARQQGACVPPREKIVLQTLRACQRLHFPMEEPASWRLGAGRALESICAG